MYSGWIAIQDPIKTSMAPFTNEVYETNKASGSILSVNETKEGEIIQEYCPVQFSERWDTLKTRTNTYHSIQTQEGTQ